MRLDKALRRGREAWLNGDLATACQQLQKAREMAPTAPEVLYPLARVLSENGGKEPALEVLDAASGHAHHSSVGTVLHALILYDYGEFDAMREAISALGTRNVLVDTLEEFAAAEQSYRPDRSSPLKVLTLHRGSLWVGESAGRLLALLEEHLHKDDLERCDRFHHRIFCPPEDVSTGDADATSPNGKDASETRESLQTKGFSHDKEWWDALEQAFRRCDHDLLVELYERKEIPEEWKDAITGVFYGFSLLVAGKEKKAKAFLAKLQQAHAPSAWTHFLSGVVHSRMGERRQAIYSFVRAAHRADIDMHFVVEQLAETLGVKLKLVD